MYPFSMMNRYAAIVAQGSRADAHAGGKTSKRGVRAVISTQEMKVYVLGKVFSGESALRVQQDITR